MLDLVVYFFRKQQLLFYSGLLAIASVYSYMLALYFLDFSTFEEKLFTTLLGLGFLWLVLFFLSFKKHKSLYAFQREKEKFTLLSAQISNEYKLEEGNNIFKKIQLISEFMKENFHTKSLLTMRVIKLINSSLGLYIDNLIMNKQLEKAISLNNNETFYKDKIEKNIEQNRAIENQLNDFIKELMNKRNNDKEVENILSEFEHSMHILKAIKSH